MAFLTINGTPVSVAVDTPELTPVYVGRQARMFDGTHKKVMRGGRKEDWKMSTTPLSVDDADALLAVLESTSALVCAGDLFGGVDTDCNAEIHRIRMMRVGSGYRKVIEFTLHEV